MPYPNEHAARINSPDKYVSMRRENNKFDDGIDVIWGIQKGDAPIEIQAIRFNKDKFTVDEAKKWLDKHDYKPIEFEPATDATKSENKFASVADAPTLKTYDMKHVHIFTVGTHVDSQGNSVTYTEKDLQNAVDDTNALDGNGEFESTLTLGHDPKQPILKTDGLPNAGLVKNFVFEDKKVYADFLNIPKRVAQFVKSGNYNGRSATIWKNFVSDKTKKKYKYIIAQVALLGAIAPALSLDRIATENYSGNNAEEDRLIYTFGINDMNLQDDVNWDGESTSNTKGTGDKNMKIMCPKCCKECELPADAKSPFVCPDCGMECCATDAKPPFVCPGCGMKCCATDVKSPFVCPGCGMECCDTSNMTPDASPNAAPTPVAPDASDVPAATNAGDQVQDASNELVNTLRAQLLDLKLQYEDVLAKLSATRSELGAIQTQNNETAALYRAKIDETEKQLEQFKASEYSRRESERDKFILSLAKRIPSVPNRELLKRVITKIEENDSPMMFSMGDKEIPVANEFRNFLTSIPENAMFLEHIESGAKSDATPEDAEMTQSQYSKFVDGIATELGLSMKKTADKKVVYAEAAKRKTVTIIG